MAETNGKEVVFYSGSGKTITDKSTEIPFDISKKTAEERLTFLDQSHTTGADVNQKLDAVSLVTIGRNMLLRDLLQAAWRLRGLDKSQRVRLLNTDEVMGIIRQKLNLSAEAFIQLVEILNFVIGNQGTQQGLDNYKGLKEEFANLMQQIMLAALTNEKLTTKSRAQAFYYLQSSWIKPATFRSKDLYGKLAVEKDRDEVLKLDKQQCQAALKDIFAKMPWLTQIGFSEKACMDVVDIIADRIKENLPPKLKVPAKEIENDQTVEMEQEAQEETEKETQTKTEKETHTQLEEQHTSEKIENLVYVNPAPLKLYATLSEAKKALKNTGTEGDELVFVIKNSHCPAFPLKDYFAQDKDLSAYSTAFEGIHLTINVLELEHHRGKAEYTNYSLLGSNRTDFHHLLV
jgi:hypothetical protein